MTSRLSFAPGNGVSHVADVVFIGSAKSDAAFENRFQVNENLDIPAGVGLDHRA